MTKRLPNAPPNPVRNALILALPEAQRERLLQRLVPTDLPAFTKLLVPDGRVERVHFVEAGTVSMIATLLDGRRVEVGMVGAEGLVGLPLLLGTETSALEALIQVEGASLSMPAAAFRTALAELPALLPLLLRYVDAFHFQVAQTAACNGSHPIEQRLARWLLMEHDRARADRFLMTQEFLSALLGVTRPGVTLAVGALHRAGLIVHAKGQMQIVSRPGLEDAACECYDVVRQRFAQLFS